jgi:DNA adenine methylase
MDIYATFESGNSLRPFHVLRYPGGKCWLSPDISFLTFVFGRYINLTYLDGIRDRIHLKPTFLIEPFAGGGVVGLSLLDKNLIKRLVLVEKDPRVAAFWRAALYDSDFADRVEKFRCTRKNVESVCGNPERDLAFWTLVKNRCSVGGNLNGGLMKKVCCRWNGKAHADALRRIRSLSPRVEFLERDGVEALREHANNPNAAAFVDPPYVVAGRGLYQHWKVDHAAIFDVLARWKGLWIMTYDSAPEIKRLLKKHRFVYREAPMRTNKGKLKKELIMRSTPPIRREFPKWKRAGR